MRFYQMCSKCHGSNGTSSSYCPKCHNEYQKNYYKKNPQSIDESNKKRKEFLRSFIRMEKDKPCKDCGKRYAWYVMDFDHLRDKEFNLSIAVNKLRSLKLVQLEIAKCDVVCANCHRERTFNRVGLGEPM